jgi:hypothetical protein
VDFIQNASAWKYVAQNFAIPGNLQTVQLCRASSAIATPECKASGTMYQAQLPELMIPRRYCPDHGGPLAGLSTDGAAQPESYASIAQIAVDEVPVARAVPVDPQAPQGEPETKYRMIRKEKGFIFQH